MAASVRVDNVSPDATETLLRQHFAFHGTISRVAIVGSSAVLEFTDAHSARSALLFDKSAFFGQTISVARVDDGEAEAMRVEAAGNSSGASDGKRSEDDFEKVEMSEAQPESAGGSASGREVHHPHQEASLRPTSGVNSHLGVESESRTGVGSDRAGDATPQAEPEHRQSGRQASAAAGGSGAGGGVLQSSVDAGRFECFKQALEEPINDARVVLATTVVALAMIALS
mmetsp:Transcript_42957/g.89723  ORF Transcript_42957/g.89723 Transcript_42957/m.89723 type:complete len:228 (+) Transcript_42957:55-738(+)